MTKKDFLTELRKNDVIRFGEPTPHLEVPHRILTSSLADCLETSLPDAEEIFIGIETSSLNTADWSGALQWFLVLRRHLLEFHATVSDRKLSAAKVSQRFLPLDRTTVSVRLDWDLKPALDSVEHTHLQLVIAGESLAVPVIQGRTRKTDLALFVAALIGRMV